MCIKGMENNNLPAEHNCQNRHYGQEQQQPKRQHANNSHQQSNNNSWNDDGILDSVLDAVGQTPLVQLHKIPKQFGVEYEIYVKCEFLNPGGSIEDRMAKAIVENAERNGHLRAGGTIISTLSGTHAGIGLAMVAAVKGYHLIYVLPAYVAHNDNSAVALSALRVLGVELIVVQVDEKKVQQRANQLAEEKRANGCAVLLLLAEGLDVKMLEFNPSIGHIAPSAMAEILAFLDSSPDLLNRLDLLVLPDGCVAHSELALIRQKCPKCRILKVFIESETPWKTTNSEWYKNEIISNGTSSSSSTNQQQNKITLNIHEQENFQIAQEMHRHEGILCGPHSGAILQATLRAATASRALPLEANDEANNEPKKKPLVIALLPDGIQLCLNGFEQIVKRNSSDDPQLQLLDKLNDAEGKEAPLEGGGEGGKQQHQNSTEEGIVSSPDCSDHQRQHSHHRHHARHPQCHHHQRYDPTKSPEHFYQKAAEPWSSILGVEQQQRQQQNGPQQNCHRPLLLDDIGQAIGNTPLVRLKRLPALHGIKAEILVKCEFLNAGGSVKDRVAQKMIEVAEACGVLRPGMTIIEPSSGNTGIAMAMQAAIKGYRCIIVMPKKMSHEKEVVIRSLGATVVRPPISSHAAQQQQHKHGHHHQHPEYHQNLVSTDKDPDKDLCVAQRLRQQIPKSIVLDQYRNDWNPFAHYATTAEEILEACQGRLDVFVAGCGTGGTLSGIARRLKELRPDIKIVGVDPEGSTLSTGGGRTDAHPYEVEGIGYDFVPAVMKHQRPDEWIRSNDANSFVIARQLIRTEGLLCGGSSGANVWASMEVAKGLAEGARVVSLLPDGIRNYMTKFINDEWMQAKGFAVEQ